MEPAKVLQDVNRLMQIRHALVMEIEYKKYLLLHPNATKEEFDAYFSETFHEDAMTTIPYHILHSVIAQRNMLLTNLVALNEVLDNEGKTTPRGGTTLCKPSMKRKSMIDRSKPPPGSMNSISNTPSPEIDNIVCSFVPSDRKFIPEETRMISGKFKNDFLRQDLFSEIPDITLEPLKGNVISTLKGPSHSSADVQSFGGYCCCHSISTYPPKPNSHVRMGDPICDRYFVNLYENRIMSALADGCSWGDRPRSAAKKASKAFATYVNAHHREPSTLRDLVKIMLEGLADAHRSIIESVDSYIEAGTTTLNGSLLLKATAGDESMYKWIFVTCNVGDCKAFHYSKKTKRVRDITKYTRQDIQNSSDPGGRLGPRGGKPKPDLRNLSVNWQYCDEGDFIFIVSDGLYDNCDLRHQGYTPSDVGLSGGNWDSCDKKQVEILSGKHVEEQLANIIGNIKDNPITADSISIALTEYCRNITENTRTFMVENPTLRLPRDYSKYPGKVDHTTAICYQVGAVNLSYNDWMKKQ